MQVELAQLEYMLPRLARMWAHLEKTRGGIGMRGPGETQLETDRRLIRHRIKTLRERLEEVRRSREVQRAGRRDVSRRRSSATRTRGSLRSCARWLGVRRLRRGSAVRDAGSADARGGPRRPYVRARDGYRRIHSEAAARSRRIVPRDAGGGERRRSAAARDRRESSGVGGASRGRRTTCSPSWRWRRSRCCTSSTRSTGWRRTSCSRCRRGCGRQWARRSSCRRSPRMGWIRCGGPCWVPCARSGPSSRCEIPVTDGRLLAEVHRSTHVLDQAQRDGVMVLRAQDRRRNGGQVARQRGKDQLGVGHC